MLCRKLIKHQLSRDALAPGFQPGERRGPGREPAARELQRRADRRQWPGLGCPRPSGGARPRGCGSGPAGGGAGPPRGQGRPPQSPRTYRAGRREKGPAPAEGYSPAYIAGGAGSQPQHSVSRAGRRQQPPPPLVVAQFVQPPPGPPPPRHGRGLARSLVHSLDRPGAARGARAGAGAGAHCARCGAGDGRGGGAALSPGRSGGGGAPRGPWPFPPGSPRGERVGGCGLSLSPPPTVLRGIAAELRPFLFRRFLPFSPGLPCGRPGPAPSRPASPSLPCGKGRARLPGATAPAPGRARCGAGRGFAGEDPARLRHQLHCAGSGGAAGGGHRAAATAPPPSPPVPPQKTQPRRRSPSLSALHHVSSSSSRPPLTPRPRGPGRCACCSLGSGPAPAWGARGRRGAASPLPGGCGERAPGPAARWGEGDGEGRLAEEPGRPRG